MLKIILFPDFISFIVTLHSPLKLKRSLQKLRFVIKFFNIDGCRRKQTITVDDVERYLLVDETRLRLKVDCNLLLLLVLKGFPLFRGLKPFFDQHRTYVNFVSCVLWPLLQARYD